MGQMTNGNEWNEWDEWIENLEGLNKKMKQTKRKTLIERMVTTLGDVELDKYEKAFLALGPNFAMFQFLSQLFCNIAI